MTDGSICASVSTTGGTVDNRVYLTGTLSCDPELKRVGKDKTALVRFTMSQTRHWKDRRSQEMKSQTTYWDVAAYGEIALNFHASIQCGDTVIVAGKLSQRECVHDGKKSVQVEILADHLGLDVSDEAIPFDSEVSTQNNP